MKYLFYFGHPAQYLFLRETIKELSLSGRHQITILIKTKDVLEDLVRKDGFPYTNILPKNRGNSVFSIGLSFFKRIGLIIPIILQKRPDVLIGTDATIAQVGKLFGLDRITILEDDYNVIKKLADLTYPFTQVILCPEVCNVGAWEAKKVGYKGYMKLAYLHPSVFTADEQITRKYNLGGRYVLIRLVSLTAHHDFGIKGISYDLVNQMIGSIEDNGYSVKISTEAVTDPRLEKYLLRIDPSDMHHVLAQSALLISDSQSMSVEAAMLGVPSIRYSDFAGKISVLEELEHTYKLTFGLKTGNETKLISQLMELIKQPDLKNLFQERRNKMLSEKINVTRFLTWFLEQYPGSVEIMKADSKYQDTFL
ncbi:hypothetical protein DYBT9275_02266 [Dyadobacter sp. CECT 9275]|uniref:DUF354 domain-containing protein n=1 Tax=Dyadobacter helix TaxID=2822344 RepID=A0A916N4A0_9BACT|nr:hypothetical protein [Dyadobacter sp. CECT 9275]CAG4999629.1 hypothetical protein DYBT9275_02266 [Dyadobacter sp. CECT 9275]